MARPVAKSFEARLGRLGPSPATSFSAHHTN